MADIDAIVDELLLGVEANVKLQQQSSIPHEGTMHNGSGLHQATTSTPYRDTLAAQTHLSSSRASSHHYMEDNLQKFTFPLPLAQDQQHQQYTSPMPKNDNNNRREEMTRDAKVSTRAQREEIHYDANREDVLDEEEDIEDVVERILAGTSSLVPAPQQYNHHHYHHSHSRSSEEGRGGQRGGGGRLRSLEDRTAHVGDDEVEREMRQHGRSDGDVRRKNGGASSPAQQQHYTSPPQRGLSTANSTASSTASGAHHSGNGGRGRGRGGRTRSARAREEDALLQRLQLWQERKEARRLQAVYEKLLKEREECTFEPSYCPEALMPDTIAKAAPTTPGRVVSSPSAWYHSPSTSQGTKNKNNNISSGITIAGLHTPSQGRVGADEGRSGSGGGGGSGAVASWDSLLAPNRLYQDNYAWGFDEYVARMEAAREERERVQKEEEAKRAHYADHQTFRRGVTVQEPFELSCYTRRPPGSGVKLRRRVSSPSSSSAVVTGHSPDEQRSGGGGGGSGDARGGDSTGIATRAAVALQPVDTFNEIAPRIREQLLFTGQMTAQLAKASCSAALSEAIRNGDTCPCDVAHGRDGSLHGVPWREGGKKMSPVTGRLQGNSNVDDGVGCMDDEVREVVDSSNSNGPQLPPTGLFSQPAREVRIASGASPPR